MVSYQSNPQARVTVTHGGSDYILDCLDILVRRVENGIDTATILLSDSKTSYSEVYSDQITKGDAIKIEEKDASDALWFALLGSTTYNGIVRGVRPEKKIDLNGLLVECDGSGHGMFMTGCVQEYGTESSHSDLDTIKKILENVNYGIIPKHVNCILGTGTSSGYNYTSTLEDVSGTINYIHFPYKPSNKCVEDLCDLLTAIKAGNAGPCWRFDPTDGFLLKTIGSVNAKWPQYYGGSQLASTLEEGIDFNEFNFEEVNPEANYVLFYGILRKPARDYWTELADPTTLWTTNAMTITGEPTIKKVGAYSLKCDNTDSNAWAKLFSAAAWDFSKIGSEQNVPTFNFWSYVDAMAGGQTAYIGLYTDGSNNYHHHVQDDTLDTWIHHSLTLGPYFKPEDWHTLGSPNWSNINYILIYHGLALFPTITIWDDMHFEGLICRAAKNSTNITNNKLKFKLITDSVGKDDGMTVGNTSGTIARSCYAELLKAQTSPIIGSFTTPILPTLLPGELIHIHAKKKADLTFKIDHDFRVIRLIQHLKNPFLTTVEVTDDVKNSNPRSFIGDINRVLSIARPEFQDRQATSIKASQVDIKVPILENNYAS